MEPKLKNMRIAQYVFMFIVILNLMSSIWIIIYDMKMVKNAEEEFPNDSYFQEKHEGHYAKYWFIGCVLVMGLNIIISLVSLYGAKIESSNMTMVVSALFAIVAVYGAWDKYMKGSITSFLIPLLASISGMLFATLNFLQMFEENSLVPGAPSIHYIRKPGSPTVQTFEESTKLNSETA